MQLPFWTTHHKQTHESSFKCFGSLSVPSLISSLPPSLSVSLHFPVLYIHFSLLACLLVVLDQTSRRSSRGRTAPPSPSKAPGVANRQFSVARRAVAVASPYCRRRPRAPSSRRPKSPRPRFPARGKVRRNNQ